jgi:hypothetical protein
VLSAHRALTSPSFEEFAGDRPPVAMEGDDTERLARLCAEAGWGEARNGSGALRVALDANGTPLQARLSLTPASTLRAVVPLATAPLTSCASREAVARLLLRVSAGVRAVKGVVLQDEDAERPALASACQARIESAAALDLALSALSVGCGRVAREAQLLEDEEVARAYLAMTSPTGKTEDASSFVGFVPAASGLRG